MAFAPTAVTLALKEASVAKQHMFNVWRGQHHSRLFREAFDDFGDPILEYCLGFGDPWFLEYSSSCSYWKVMLLMMI